MANLQEEILRLINPTPVFKDPENNSDDETVARVVDKDETVSDDVQHPSDLRRKAAVYLVESDKRYAGKQTSRKDLAFDEASSPGEDSDDDDDMSDASFSETSKNVLNKLGFSADSEEEEEDSNVEGDDEEMEEEEEQDIASFKSKLSKKDSSFSFTDDGDYSKYASDDDDDEDDDDEDDDDDDDDDDKSDEEELLEDEDLDGKSETGGKMQTFRSADSDETAKGVAAKQQLGLWDSVLECRIKLQQVFSLINQLPQHNTWTQWSSHQPFKDEATKSEELLKNLLGQLVHMQEHLLTQNTETKPLLEESAAADKAKDKAEEDDEEIPSDSEDGDEEKDEKPETDNKPNARKRKISLDEYPELLKRRNDRFTSYRNSTIQKWYDKTRLAGGRLKGKSFEAFDQSVLVQIKQILGDRERLVKRTQLKRSVYRVLGSNPTSQPTEDQAETEEKSAATKEYDEEIFDDDDFYHQLLRELIERKTADVNDPIALSRQWLQIQKLRTKSKKNVDTKASKGRKLRYDVHKKLVNFMPPQDTSGWSHEARDDLFKSLFGKLVSSGL